MASAMVLTSVPVVTMAASTTSVSKVVTTASTTQALGTVAPIVKTTLKDTLTSNQFYLELEGAEWAKDASGNFLTTEVKLGTEVVGTITPDSKTDATVVIDADELDKLVAGESLTFQLDHAIVKAEEAYIVIDGNETEITDSKALFAKTSSAKATVTSKNDQTFYTTKGSAISDIVVEEAVAGTFAKNHTIVIDLDNTDFEFVNSNITVTGTKGMTTVSVLNVDIQDDSIEITIEGNKTSQKGGYKVSGIEVKSVDKAPATGELNVTVSGSNVDKEKTINTTTLAVAKIAEYGASLTVKEKQEVVAGKETEVTVTLSENTEDSIASNEVEFTLSQGVMADASAISIEGVDASDITMVPVDKKDLTKGYNGFIVDFGGDNTAFDKLVATLKITTTVATEGEIAVAVEGRFVEEQTVVVATATPSFAVATEAMTLKVGQSKQVGGKITITEKEAGAFKRGTKFEIEVPTEDGITLTELPEVSATNGMTVKASWKTGTKATTSPVIVVEVTKASREEAAEIVIEKFEAKVDRTVAQGSYDATLKVDGLKGEVEVADFVVIGTANTEDIVGSNGLVKGTSTFVIGESKYVVNGVEKTMDAKSYIKDPGFTMVPVRYVAEAFGVEGNDIMFNNGTVTIFAGTRTIQLTNNSDIAIVNGVQIKMATKVVIKDGRTYAPISEVAQLLGISKGWDNTTKTATFENK